MGLSLPRERNRGGVPLRNDEGVHLAHKTGDRRGMYLH